MEIHAGEQKFFSAHPHKFNIPIAAKPLISGGGKYG